MKPLVLLSLIVLGGMNHSVQAAQPINKSPIKSSQTSTVSIIKTETIEFVGQNEVLLQQQSTQSGSASGSTLMCVSSSSSDAEITLSTANDGFTLRDEISGNSIPYKASLSVTQQNNSAECQHGRQYKLSLSVPQNLYNSALPGNYTDTLTITIAAE